MTEESYLDAYGGEVTTEQPKISMFGEFALTFNRPIIFPTDLVSDYIEGYVEDLPEVPSKA